MNPVNLFLFGFTILLCIGPLCIYLKDVWLRDAQQKRLREKFESWWLTVQDYDDLKLSLLFTIKIETMLSGVFGERLLSWKSLYRTSLPATGLLFASLSIVGLINHNVLGMQPWKNYHQTAELVRTTIPQLQATYRSAAVQQQTNAYSTKNATNLASVAFTTNQVAMEFVRILETAKDTTNKYSTLGYEIAYSVLMILSLVGLNGFLCFFSFAISRAILKEIVAAGRPLSTLALLVTNALFVSIISTFCLILLTVLATPLVWYFLPLVPILAKESWEVFMLVLLSGGVVSWLFASPALKVVTLIALLPCLVTMLITLLSWIALLSRKSFHRLVSAVLLRCAEKGPLLVIAGTSVLLATLFGIISASFKYLH